ncbi:MAG TPA: hypothetical protein VN541_16185 [Tepidisphaeraceae bacterium]|nr:hypothetical protein [Tepidisphaeraceae bacterium]
MAIYQMRFGLSRPRYGRIDVSLETEKPVLQFAASATSRDSIGELASALAQTLKGGPGATVVWNAEPSAYEFAFAPDQGAALLTITQWPDSRRVKGAGQELLRVRGRPSDVCLPFWRALQRLQSQTPGNEYKMAWGHPFPTGELAEVTTLVQRSKTAY